MFKELGPLPRQGTVVMILARLEDETIPINVIPRKLKESENDAPATPLSVIGTAEDLNAQMPSPPRIRVTLQSGESRFLIELPSIGQPDR